MRGDTTRDSFRPERHFRSVLQQQGRVSLDAEWNEQRSIDDHLRHTALTDVIGTAAGPLGAAAFGLTVVGGVVTIGAGRYYVDGMLLENAAATAITAQPDLPAGVAPYLDASGAPLNPPTAGRYLAELDVWTRLITALDDPEIREIAVPVPDTTTRARTVWQVRLIRVGAQGASIHCGDTIPAWSTLRAPTTGRLRARTQPGDDASTPCEVPAGAGFRGADNQHYRVEVRNGGTSGTATFVWSRDNGSVQARWIGQSGNQLTVAIPSRDSVTGFTAGAWIELVDDRTELGGTPGVMVQIDTVHDDVIEIKPATAIPGGSTVDLTTMGPNPKVRRWDAPPAVTGAGYLPLERGVEVEFEAARTYRTGEYWSIPARTALADVQWPEVGGARVFLRPRGIRHDYARLGLLEFDGTTWTPVEDCRTLFPPLSDLLLLRYAGGDGQHAAPDPANSTTLVPLQQRLRVAVTYGDMPVQGATVHFAVTTGSGVVDAGAGPAASVDATTGADGIASVSWSVDSAAPLQVVVASLIGAGGQQRDTAITFSASLMRASGVTVDPSTCPTLIGTTNVQEALEALCKATHTGCATVVVTPGPGWDAPLRQLAPGTSARICFTPGEYRLGDPLVFRSLVDVSLDGAGWGSVVVAEDTETAMLFTGCRSVTIRDLTIEARVVKEGGDPGQGGAVTITETAAVHVDHAAFRCAGGSRQQSSCLNVIGVGRGTRVEIRDSSFAVGHLQTGIIVVNGNHVRITDNVISVDGKTAKTQLSQLLRDPIRVRKLIGRLIVAPTLLDGPSLAERGTAIRVGPWLTRFDSTLPHDEWLARIKTAPPTDADLTDAATVRAYMNRLADDAVAQPSVMPGFERRVSELRRTIGGADFERLLTEPAGRMSIKALLLGPAIDVVSAVSTAPDRVSVQLGAGHVEFTSPVPEAGWRLALRLNDITATETSAALRDALYDVARRVLTDAEFRVQLSPFARWFQLLVDKNRAAASLGVLCAGAIAEDVTIAGNRITGTVEAIRVAVSKVATATDPPVMAGTVQVSGNECTLSLPVEQPRGRQGMFFGNCQRLAVDDNTVSVPGTARGTSAYDLGVRVHGHLGSRLTIEQNVLDHSDIGVRVAALSGTAFPHRWAVEDNVAPAAAPAVSVPPSVIDSGNIGR